jgi:nucleoside-diphosphate-sugar epimerase
MSVLLTGITGFIGSELGRRLVKEGYTVHGLIRHTSGRTLEPIADYLDKVHLVQGDLREYHSVRLVVRESNPEFIVHLGALTPVRLSFDDPFSCVDVNMLGTVNLVHAALANLPNLRRFMLASTMEVYGWQDKEEPFSESLSLCPASPYAVSKAAADMYVRMSGRVNALDYTVLRPCNSYGRKHEMGFVVEYLVTQMLRKSKVYLGTPTSRRDMLHVDDHVAAYLAAMNNEHASMETFNVGTGNAMQMGELAKMIADLTDYHDDIIEGYPPGYPMRPASADPKYLSLNPKKIRDRLGWEPKQDLVGGLRKTVEYWRARLDL